jgi:formylmethanofuran dehydrogenase subunit E
LPGPYGPEEVRVEDRETFMELLDRAAAFHGHLCSGQIVGVRLAMLGLRLLGIATGKGWSSWSRSPGARPMRS